MLKFCGKTLVELYSLAKNRPSNSLNLTVDLVNTKNYRTESEIHVYIFQVI